MKYSYFPVLNTIRLTLFIFLFLQGNAPVDILAQTKNYETKKIGGNPPVLDGRLIEAAWNTVEWQSDFTQTKPYDGGEPEQKTSFKRSACIRI